MKNGDTSVIISVWNRAENLAYCVRSALWQMHEPLEIIVVNYTDGPPVTVPDGVRLIHWPSNGQWNNPRASNIGAANASGERLAFLNCDNIMAPDLLYLAGRILDRDPLGHVYWERWDLSKDGLQALRSTEWLDLYTPLIADMQGPFAGWWEKGTPSDAPGDFLMIDADIYKGLGGYDERYTGWGAYDSDLLARLVAEGHKEHRGGGVKLIHQHHELQSRKKTARNRHLYEMSKARVDKVRNGGRTHFERYEDGGQSCGSW